MILKANANAETIKTYILNLEQKLSSLTSFFGRENQYYIQYKT